MTEYIRNRLDKQQGLVNLVIGILLFGSLWGLLEATLGGFLHMIIFPNKGAIMSGIGVALMSSALAIYKRPIMLPGIGIVAASFKLLNVWLLFVPISAISIINPAMAIIFESLVFGVVAVFLMNRISKNALVGVGAGVLIALVSATAWVYFAIYVMDAPRYARVVFTAGEFIANQGVVQAAFWGILLPLGYLVGKRLALLNYPVFNRRSVYFGTAIATICLCWGISALSVIGGI